MLDRLLIFMNLALAALVMLVASPVVEGVQCVKAKEDLIQQEAECLCPAEDVRTATLHPQPPAATSDILSTDCCGQCIDLPIGTPDLNFVVADVGAGNLKDSTTAALHTNNFELQRARLLQISDRGSVTYSPVSDLVATPLRI